MVMVSKPKKSKKKLVIMREFDLMKAEMRAEDLARGHFAMGQAVELIYKLIASNKALLEKYEGK